MGSFMKNALKVCFVLVCLMVLGAGAHLRNGAFVFEPPARAAAQLDDSSPFACSLQTIQGSYGTSTTGSIVSAGPIGQVADVGVITFDGKGGVSQTTTVSLNGMIIPSRSSLSGSYEVNSDCTGDISLTLPTPTGTTTSTSKFVVIRNGEELLTINTGTGRVLSGSAKRQYPRSW
jgi:hypothetical protein